jgi:NADPH:quinone reductase-like Zn-dependent oxidoreductase
VSRSSSPLLDAGAESVPDTDRSTMRAAVLDAPRTVTLVDAPRPEPGPGQLRLRLEGSGVCGSNLPPWEGRDWFTYPFAAGAPGHEGWGRVDALGAGVSGFAVGDRVAALSERAYAEYDVVGVDGVVRLPAALDGHASARSTPGRRW